MARPCKYRRICTEPAYDSFSPQGVPSPGRVILTVDEYEAVRLVDLEGYTQQQCAEQMEVARTTVTALYESARHKLADSIVNGKPLYIFGGHYRMCDGASVACCHMPCRKLRRQASQPLLQRKENATMRIAVTYENELVFQHFGHTAQLKLYDIEEKKVVRQQIIDTNGQGHGALVQFLADARVDVVICGGIGAGAQTALTEAGIQLFGGVPGKADDAVLDYLAGTLQFNPDVHCTHHEHEGSCGEEKHGCSGNGGCQ
jgi:predicted DNA-binding protein (UPF0251 family)/predicted Fe-Mo cluster-binding NifX family protein